MIGEILVAFLIPVGAFLLFPLVGGLFLLNTLTPLNNYQTIAYWIGVTIAQIWWVVTLYFAYAQRSE